MGETETASPLDNLSVAAPCRANWKDMRGDEQARFCQLCNKHVYNLSAMDRTAVEALIRQKEGKLCVRFYQRADGTIMTDNCPIGLRAIRKRFRWVGIALAAVATVFAMICGIVLASATGSPRARMLIQSIFQPQPEKQPPCVMGELKAR